MAQNNLEKLNRNIYNIQRELKTLRSFIIDYLGKDKEGEYHPDFVKKVIKANSEDTSFIFRDKQSFLKKIQS